MYSLSDPIAAVKGAGDATVAACEAVGIFTIRDLLLYLPLRYQDFSVQLTTSDFLPGTTGTLEAQVTSVSTSYRGRMVMTRATLKDTAGSLKAMWFNNKFVGSLLQKGESYQFSGTVNDRGFLMQPAVEKISNSHIHTGRLVPIYSTSLKLKQGTLRRLQYTILEELDMGVDPLGSFLDSTAIAPLSRSLSQLHYPDTKEAVIAGRQRLALDELLALIITSQKLKAEWRNTTAAFAIPTPAAKDLIPDTIPFELTSDQKQAIAEICKDLAQEHPMNRLLVGDVGSGKTVVAGTAAFHTLQVGHSACLVAPTQLLAQQHAQTLAKLFPSLPVAVITGRQKADTSKPSFFVGTHALLNKLSEINPALLIFDEQHRFGVSHRSFTQDLHTQPHILTMSATPIPRSYMLTVFSHLQLSTIKQLPAGRKETKTWLLPENKRKSSYEWIADHLNQNPKDLVVCVCPFIDPSQANSLENVAAVTSYVEHIQKAFPKTPGRIAVLHGRQPATLKEEILTDLYSQKISILVTTPIVEVGVDIPTASIMVIEGAERFGLASLHQLRGRVGRAGQQGYCLLFSTNTRPEENERLKIFSETHDGFTLAELDLKQRGAGNLFGTQQHGFDQLKFADWADMKLIATAQKIAGHLPQNWVPFLPVVESKTTPLAN